MEEMPLLPVCTNAARFFALGARDVAKPPRLRPQTCSVVIAKCNKLVLRGWCVNGGKTGRTRIHGWMLLL